MKNSQVHKLSQNNMNIAIQQANREYQQEKTQRSRALIEITQNDNNVAVTNPEALSYKVDGYATVAAGNHFYVHNQPKYHNSINSTTNNSTLEHQSFVAYKKTIL